jgi:primosomal protein N' (replication factor Y)
MVAVDEIDPSIRYKAIMEIVDTEPIVSTSMLELAAWMSNYYHTTMGIVIDTMLPLALKHHVTQKLRLCPEQRDYLANSDKDSLYLSSTEIKIIETLETSENLQSEGKWMPVETLRDSIKVIDFYFALESLENHGFIEIFRTFDEKIKPKYANFVRVLSIGTEVAEANILDNLTDKQKQALQIIIAKGDVDIPLSTLTSEVSASMIRTLRTKGFINVYAKKIDLALFTFPSEQTQKKISLNHEQISAVEKTTMAIDRDAFHTFLLFGVTGSGKTEVYIEAILHARKQGKSALMLVPEISLTPQMVHKFYHVFGSDIAVLHSNLNDRERYLQWKQIARGEIQIVIGARSAIFAPLKNLGVIIIDEEHESSYKQDHHPCYNARDLAVKRGSIEKCVVILGSATPSLESWNNALRSRYTMLTLSIRPAGATLPPVRIIDMRDDNSLFSIDLTQLIQDRLDKSEQVILFHNRRGYANFVQCVTCGHLYKCPACDISLTLHKSENIILCHYCGYYEEVSRKCPECGSYHFIFGAPGTEQIHKQLQILFPTAKILRMDSDTTKRKSSYDDMFDAMRQHHIDILLGTQMISKGLDFHNVTLVGVISADITLNVPDFRSVERTFQLLTQVAGRSGRGEKKGEVIIQTRAPEHYALNFAGKQDFLSFSHTELAMRSEAMYPPYLRLCRVLFSCPDLNMLKSKLIDSKALLLKCQLCFPEDEFILLPFIEAPISRIKNSYRYHFIVKSTKTEYIQRFLDMFLAEFDCPSQIKMIVDVDPMSLL